MLNIDKVETVYLACGFTDLRKSIDGLVMIVQSQLKLDPFEKALFVFCNKQMDKLKILHFDEGFWLYYFVIGRKNFLFANTAKGATSSAIIYSIIETAKTNNVVVEKYLVHLFDNLSKLDYQVNENLEHLMPWSHKIPENMKIKDKK